MLADAWRQQAINAVREAEEGDPRMLDRLALLLEQQDETVRALRELGEGWTLERLLDWLREQPSIKRVVAESLASVVEDALDDAVRSGIAVAVRDGLGVRLD
jgi:hypothetical protein